MIYTDAPRIEIPGPRRKVTTLCSELCRDEYVGLYGLDDGGSWRTPTVPTEARG